MPVGMGGVTQPGGVGTTIYVYDDAHADAGGKGYYNLADILARVGGVGGPAVGDFGSTGTVPDEYWSAVIISFSDNTGSTLGVKTTWQEQRSTIKFTAANTGILTATNTTVAADITFKLGTKINASSPRSATYEGVKVCNRRTMLWRGTFFIYASTIITDTGNYFIFPYAASTPSEALGNRFELWGTGVIAPGTGVFNWAVLYNNTYVGGATATTINNMSVTDAEDVIIASSTSPLYLLNTGSLVQGKNIIFKGSPTNAEIRTTGTFTWVLVNPKFADTALRTDTAVSPIQQWWDFNVFVVDGAGNPVSGVPVTVWDNTFTPVVTGYTNTDGLLSYNSGLTLNAIKVAEWQGGVGSVVETKWWPFRVGVGGAKPFKFTFPHTTGAFGELYLPHMLVYNITTGEVFFSLASESVIGS